MRTIISQDNSDGLASIRQLTLLFSLCTAVHLVACGSDEPARPQAPKTEAKPPAPALVQLPKRTEAKPPAPALVQLPKKTEAKPPAPALVQLPKYEVVDEDLSDTPIKTAFDLRVVIDKGTTKTQLDALMRSIHKEYMTKSGFRYHNPPNSIYAFFFYSEKVLKEDPTGWVGRIQHPASAGSPKFENNILEGDLVSMVKQAMGIKDSDKPTASMIELGDDGQTIIYTSHLTGSGSDGYETTVYPRSVWMGVFIGLDLLYKKVPKLDKLTYREIHKGKTIIEISLDRILWNGMHYNTSTDAIADADDKLMTLLLANKLSDDSYEKKLDAVSLKVYGKMLKTLPTKNVKVKKIVKLK
jgi:hypothetical protein